MGENHLGKLKCECGSGDLGTRGSATGFLTNPNLSEFRAGELLHTFLLIYG